MLAAEDSVGVTYGLESARMQLRMLVEELEFLASQLDEVEQRMDELLGIKSVGIVTAASFLGEIGDPLRFDSPRQIHRMAGYNLVENSSGQNRSGTSISKRGRKQLRSLLYKMAIVMVCHNSEMKQLYQYLKNRPDNPLKGKQALIVISKKIVTVIYRVLKTRTEYQPALVLGPVRKQQLGLAA